MFTAIQGIIRGYNKDKIWIYNNYILLWADRNINSSAYWSDFKFADEANQEEFLTADFYKGIYQTCRLTYDSVLKGYSSNEEGEDLQPLRRGSIASVTLFCKERTNE